MCQSRNFSLNKLKIHQNIPSNNFSLYLPLSPPLSHSATPSSNFLLVILLVSNLIYNHHLTVPLSSSSSLFSIIVLSSPFFSITFFSYPTPSSLVLFLLWCIGKKGMKKDCSSLVRERTIFWYIWKNIWCGVGTWNILYNHSISSTTFFGLLSMNLFSSWYLCPFCMPFLLFTQYTILPMHLVIMPSSQLYFPFLYALIHTYSPT